MKNWENGENFVLDNAGGLRPVNIELTEQSEWWLKHEKKSQAMW